MQAHNKLFHRQTDTQRELLVFSLKVNSRREAPGDCKMDVTKGNVKRQVTS